jgi:hypothetical protein
MSDASAQISLQSPAGYTLLRQTTRDLLPYDPHDTSIEALAAFLECKDVLVRMACGSGKTGIIALLAVSLPLFHEMTSFKPWFDKDPVLLVICPTNTLEIDIVCPSAIFAFLLIATDILYIGTQAE